MQLATEEAQEMLLEEIPESPSTKPRHWYLAGAGLALLVVLGVAAKVVYRSPETLLQSKNFDINTVQEWEQIPGIDQVVEHAKTLELKQPLRNLNDLFYESQPEELPWIRTECVIDVVQGAAYLGQAVVFLYKAIKYDGIRCPDNSPAGCAASIAGFRGHGITSEWCSWAANLAKQCRNARCIVCILAACGIAAWMCHHLPKLLHLSVAPRYSQSARLIHARRYRNARHPCRNSQSHLASCCGATILM